MSSNRQKISYTQVEYKVYYVEDGPDSGKIPACITIANIFGMKDILLRNQPMASGEMFYWPAKMIYATTVQNLMSERRINFEDSKFLRTVTTSTSGQNRPLVILSFLSGKQIKRFSLKSLSEYLVLSFSSGTPEITSIMSFKEVNNYLKLMIQNAVDPASNTTPKKVFNLNITERTLTDKELDALIVVSEYIGPITTTITST
jgi:hypothetical protein